MKPCTQLGLWGSAETRTDCWATQMGRLRYAHRPSLNSCTRGSKMPYPFAHVGAHTHLLQKPLHHIHTAGQRQGGGGGRPGAELRKRHAKGLAGGCADSSCLSLLCQGPWGSQLLEPKMRTWLLEDPESGMAQSR